MGQKRGGITRVAIDGKVVDAKGAWTVNRGDPKRSAIVGADRIHGYQDEVQVPMAKGAITIRPGEDPSEITNIENATVEVAFAGGLTFVLRNAWFSGDGETATKEGELTAEFEGETADWLT